MTDTLKYNALLDIIEKRQAMNRYSVVTCDPCELDIDAGGMWVMYDDVKDEIERNRAAIAELVDTLKEYIAAADNSMNPPDDDDVSAMLRFGMADKSARAAITKHQQPPISEQSTKKD